MSSRIHRSMLMAGWSVMVASGLWGCAPMHVNSYAERSAAFQQYRTFAWGPADTKSTGDPRLDSNRFFDERVRLKWRKSSRVAASRRPRSSPDLLVHYHVNVSQEIDVRQLDGCTRQTTLTSAPGCTTRAPCSWIWSNPGPAVCCGVGGRKAALTVPSTARR